MAKQAGDWRPDIYDLAAGRAIGDAGDLTGAEIQSEPVAIAPLVAGRDDAQARVTVRYSTSESRGDFYALAGMIAGAVGGAVIGLLLAPKRGDETLRQLTSQARQQIEQGIDKVSRVAENAGDTAASAAPGPTSFSGSREEEV